MPSNVTARALVAISISLMVSQVGSSKKNILFLVSDDMRPQLGSYYGPDFPSPVHPFMHTPNLDNLAAQSLVLKKAYVQQAVCSPSRTSLLTGRRPDTTHVYNMVDYFRNVGGNFTTIPQYFKESGYTSIGMGKVFHPGKASGFDDPISWSEPYFHAPNYPFWQTNRASWLAVTKKERSHKELPDIQITNYAIQTLRRVTKDAKSGTKPFFIAVGIHKPHLPFVFPEEFLQYYPVEELSLPDNGYAPVNMPPVAWYNYSKQLGRFKDLAKYHMSGNINTSLPNDVVIDLRRAYYSALSYTDSLIGTLLEELKSLGLWNDTIVSFWGDHGWQLGEHGAWLKETNFELATHAPMMVRVPGLTDNGIVTEELTEFVDLFPTLVEAAGFPKLELCPENNTAVKRCREGHSLVPFMKANGTIKWKERVFSQYPRPGSIMGYTMRTKMYRYTEWVRFYGAPIYKPEWSSLHGVELYDHVKDPEENYNAAFDPYYERVRRELSIELRAGWRRASDDRD